MKRKGYVWLFGLLMSVMALGFSGCSSDDDEPGSSSVLVGTWECTYSYWCVKQNGVIVYEEENDDVGHRVTFNADGTFYEDGEMCEWSYKGGRLTLTYVDGGETYTDSCPITNLTSTKFTIEMTETEREDGDTYEYYDKLIYKKVSGE